MRSADDCVRIARKQSRAPVLRVELLRSRGSRFAAGLLDQLLSNLANAGLFFVLIQLVDSGNLAAISLALLFGQLGGSLGRAAFAEPLVFAEPAYRQDELRRLHRGLRKTLIPVVTLAGALTSVLYTSGSLMPFLLVIAVPITAIAEGWRASLLVVGAPGRALMFDLAWASPVPFAFVPSVFAGSSDSAVILVSLVIVPSVAVLISRPTTSGQVQDALRSGKHSSCRVDPRLRRSFVLERILGIGNAGGVMALASLVPGVSAAVLRSTQVAVGPLSSLNLAGTLIGPGLVRDSEHRFKDWHAAMIAVFTALGYTLVVGLFLTIWPVFGPDLTNDLLRVWPIIVILKVMDSLSALYFVILRSTQDERINIRIKAAGTAVVFVGIPIMAWLNAGIASFFTALAVIRLAQVGGWIYARAKL